MYLLWLFLISLGSLLSDGTDPAIERSTWSSAVTSCVLFSSRSIGPDHVAIWAEIVWSGTLMSDAKHGLVINKSLKVARSQTD